MVNWDHLTSIDEVDRLDEYSQQQVCLIFKHSTRCSISSIAKHRLSSDWAFAEHELRPYFLDLIAFRNVSNEIADRYQVYHESPQVLLIYKGECFFDSSHLDISVGELREQLTKESIQ